MFVAIFIISLVYGVIKLTRPGISQDVRKKVLGRHALYIIFFFIVNLYTMGSSMLSNKKVLRAFRHGYFQNNTFVLILKLLFQVQGIFMPFLRVFEPYFFRVFREKTLDLICCCRKSETSADVKQVAPLFMFLASSLNVELVYIILQGITQFSVLQTNMTHHSDSANIVFQTREEQRKGD